MAKTEATPRVTLKARVQQLEELVKKLTSRADNVDNKIITVSKEFERDHNVLVDRVKSLEAEVK